MALLNFNAASVAPAPSSFAPIPAGTYNAVITDSVMKPTRSGTGSYLELTLEILEGEHHGRRIWDRLNLENQNPKAVEIAQRTLASICNAVGVVSLTDSNQLHNLPLRVVVRTRIDSDGNLTNEVRGYQPRLAQAPAPAPAYVAPAPAPAYAAPAPQPQQAPSAPINNASPWAR